MKTHEDYLADFPYLLPSQHPTFSGEIRKMKFLLAPLIAALMRLCIGDETFIRPLRGKQKKPSFKKSHERSEPMLMTQPLKAWLWRQQWSCPLYFCKNLIPGLKPKIIPYIWSVVYDSGWMEMWKAWWRKNAQFSISSLNNKVDHSSRQLICLLNSWWRVKWGLFYDWF